MAHILQTTFFNIFPLISNAFWFHIPLSYSQDPINNQSSLFQITAWCTIGVTVKSVSLILGNSMSNKARHYSCMLGFKFIHVSKWAPDEYESNYSKTNCASNLNCDGKFHSESFLHGKPCVVTRRSCTSTQHDSDTCEIIYIYPWRMVIISLNTANILTWIHSLFALKCFRLAGKTSGQQRDRMKWYAHVGLAVILFVVSILVVIT